MKHFIWPKACAFLFLWAMQTWPQQPTSFMSITPGGVWLADDGKPIDCHAGNIIYSVGSANSQYVFLPITITSTGVMQIKWAASWTLGVFTPGSIEDKNGFDFKKAVFSNARNNTGLHAFDLLGRRQLSFIPAQSGSTIVQLKNAGCGIGEYIVR